MTPPPPPEPGSDAASSDAAAIAAAYTFDAPALQLGALMVDGQPHANTQIRIPLAMLNRHGLVAGATGTGKTKSLQGLAEQLSAAGVPVFLADVKGDLSGLGAAGESSDKVLKRTAALGQTWSATAFPVEFLSLGGAGNGTPIRATVTSFGPNLLAKVLGLNETQESSLELVFHYADTKSLPLLDLKDLRAVVQYLTSDEGKGELKDIGGVSAATAGVILRELTAFAAKGAEQFFGEPEFDVKDVLRTAPDGRGVISVLELPAVQDRPELFSTFLMWLLAELFETLPEVGDVDKPKLVFFFDEAHLLFNGATRAFLDSVTQTVRLIRSKGVGVFFVTQTPKDVPSDVLAQLANRIQHALRAFTPDDAKALRATVSTFPRSHYDLAQVLTTLGIGEAVVTVMSETGAPTPVAWTRLRAPESRMAPMDDQAMAAAVTASPLNPRYAQAVDRDSAYEMLGRRMAGQEATAQAQAQQNQQNQPAPTPGTAPETGSAPSRARTQRPQHEQSALEAILTNKATQKIAMNVGKELVRGLFGNRRR
ncbi:MAG: helicase HerA-like domain-containing protein [Actinocrinis sp.]